MSPESSAVPLTPAIARVIGPMIWCVGCSRAMSGADADDCCSGCAKPIADTLSAAGIDPKSLTAVESARCTRCGYNLYLTSVSGTCPECGTSVIHALFPRPLPYCDVAYLRRVRGGFTCLGIAVMLATWFFALLQLLQLLVQVVLIPVALQLMVPTASLCFALAAFLTTTPCPHPAIFRTSRPLRVVIRVCGLIVPCGTAMHFFFWNAKLIPGWLLFASAAVGVVAYCFYWVGMIITSTRRPWAVCVLLVCAMTFGIVSMVALANVGTIPDAFAVTLIVAWHAGWTFAIIATRRELAEAIARQSRDGGDGRTDDSAHTGDG